jgi:hypothetical protein
MTDYIASLQQALRDAAAREYPARVSSPEPTSRPASSQTRRRRRTITAGLSTAVAAVTAAVVLLVGATTAARPAYALVQHADGSVTVTVHNLHTAIRPINARLTELGIPIRFIPITDGCPASNGGFVYPVKPSQYPQLRWTFTQQGSRKMSPGDWGYIGIGRSDRGELLLAGGAEKPPLPSCFNSTLGKIVPPSGSQPNGASPPSGLFSPLDTRRTQAA